MHHITISLPGWFGDCFGQLATKVDFFCRSDAEIKERYEVPDHCRINENILLE
jgi:hypothetical protein